MINALNTHVNATPSDMMGSQRNPVRLTLYVAGDLHADHLLCDADDYSHPRTSIPPDMFGGVWAKPLTSKRHARQYLEWTDPGR